MAAEDVDEVEEGESLSLLASRPFECCPVVIRPPAADAVLPRPATVDTSCSRRCVKYTFSAGLLLAASAAAALVDLRPAAAAALLQAAEWGEAARTPRPRSGPAPAGLAGAGVLVASPPAAIPPSAASLAVAAPAPLPTLAVRPPDDGEALRCAEYAVVYRPMDMNGEALSMEGGVAACQERCRRTSTCAHYAYYLPSGHCHLQDAFASPTFNNLEWISGPSGCTMEERSPAILTVLMYKKVCYEADTGYYALDMDALTPMWAPSVLECQQRCRRQHLCAHFTYSSISGTCHLAAPEAIAMRNPESGNIAGPPRCHVPREKLLQISLQRAAAVCSGAGEDCRATRCCSQPGMHCYERDGGWATCLASCTLHAGSASTRGSGLDAAWSCKRLVPEPGTPALPLGPPTGPRPAGRPAPRLTPPPAPPSPAPRPPVRDPPGACSAADGEAWHGGGKDAFEEDMNKCGALCLGGSFCVSDCVVRRHGYSASCAKCFGGAAACTVQHCIWQCMGGPHAPGCRDCTKANCRPPFQECTGFTAPHAADQ